MISWCAYCQRFQRELPPYENYGLTYGLCMECARKGWEFSQEDHARTAPLKDLYAVLYAAGLSEDLKSAESAIAWARSIGVSPIDMLMGVIAPILWRIGDLWVAGKITIAEENRFSQFCERIIAFLSESGSEAKPRQATLLLVNAPGNPHTLGIQVCGLWLQSQGIPTRMMPDSSSFGDLAGAVAQSAVPFLGISVAMPEHLDAAERLIGDLRRHFGPACPQILLGGNAVKSKAVSAVRGALVVAEPHDVVRLIRADFEGA